MRDFTPGSCKWGRGWTVRWEGALSGEGQKGLALT